MERIKVTLDDDEYMALGALAELELRSLPDQARLIVREQLRQRGLLLSEADFEKGKVLVSAAS